MRWKQICEDQTYTTNILNQLASQVEVVFIKIKPAGNEVGTWLNV